jgi:hypothetical protein
MSLRKLRILQQINDIKTDFYAQNSKNFFFKKTQKQELSNKITQQISVSDLIDVSMYRFSTENRVYVDYSIIKMYIDSPIYDQLCEKLIQLLANFMNTNTNTNTQTYEIHINLDGFTITSAERHKMVIEQFCQKMNNTKHFDYMDKMYIYNTPSMIDAISGLFSYLIHPNMKQKMVKYDKDNSADKIVEIEKQLLDAPVLQNT